MRERMTYTDDEMDAEGVGCPVKDTSENFDFICSRVCSGNIIDCPYAQMGLRLKEYEDAEENNGK